MTDFQKGIFMTFEQVLMGCKKECQDAISNEDVRFVVRGPYSRKSGGYYGGVVAYLFKNGRICGPHSYALTIASDENECSESLLEVFLTGLPKLEKEIKIGLAGLSA